MLEEEKYRYPSLEENTFRWRKFVLTEVDEIISHGVLLIARKGEYYNFYLPARTAFRKGTYPGVDEDQLICIFENIKEYVYEAGLLLIKEGDEEKGNWVMVWPNAVSWYLTPERAKGRMKVSPRISYIGKSVVKILPEFSNLVNCLVVDIDETQYLVRKLDFYVLDEEAQVLDAKPMQVKKTKIQNFIITANPKGEFSFVRYGKIEEKSYAKIEEFAEGDYEYFSESFHGYWCFNEQGEVEAFEIGNDNPEDYQRECLDRGYYDYAVKFSEPVQEVKFLGHRIIEAKRSREDTTFYSYLAPKGPGVVVDIWKLQRKGKEEYLFKIVGEHSGKVEFIVPKEMLLM